jgi:hypothetical protein
MKGRSAQALRPRSLAKNLLRSTANPIQKACAVRLFSPSPARLGTHKILFAHIICERRRVPVG